MNTLARKVRVALTPRNWLLKTTLPNGAFVYGANRKGFGGRGIYIWGESIEPEFQHLEKFLDPSAVLVDVGANTGIYTIKAAKWLSAGGGTVVSMEPFPEIFATLFKSIQDNGFNNVRLRNFCAGDHNGSATFWRNFDKPNSYSLVNRDKKASCFSAMTVAIDDLFGWEKLDRLDYLKIDAEGAEEQVLRGGSKTIEKYRPIIQVEVSINDVPIDLPDYSAFQPPLSINRVYIPNDSPKISLPAQLGWVQSSC
jgi:FkbM family methyltransferase